MRNPGESSEPRAESETRGEGEMLQNLSVLYSSNKLFLVVVSLCEV